VENTSVAFSWLCYYFVSTVDMRTCWQLAWMSECCVNGSDWHQTICRCCRHLESRIPCTNRSCPLKRPMLSCLDHQKVSIGSCVLSWHYIIIFIILIIFIVVLFFSSTVIFAVLIIVIGVIISSLRISFCISISINLCSTICPHYYTVRTVLCCIVHWSCAQS